MTTSERELREDFERFIERRDRALGANQQGYSEEEREETRRAANQALAFLLRSLARQILL
jgi:hypothetical protein